MSRFRVLLSNVVVILCVGCAQVSVTYHTNPEGAQLVELQTGKSYTAPVTLSYDLGYQAIKDPCVPLAPIEISWESGVTARAKGARICGGAFGGNYIIVVQRPSVPGLDIDLKAARRHVSVSRPGHSAALTQASGSQGSPFVAHLLEAIATGVVRGLADSELKTRNLPYYGQTPDHRFQLGTPRKVTCTPSYFRADLMTGAPLYDCN